LESPVQNVIAPRILTASASDRDFSWRADAAHSKCRCNSIEGDAPLDDDKACFRGRCRFAGSRHDGCAGVASIRFAGAHRLDSAG